MTSAPYQVIHAIVRRQRMVVKRICIKSKQVEKSKGKSCRSMYATPYHSPRSFSFIIVQHCPHPLAPGSAELYFQTDSESAQ